MNILDGFELFCSEKCLIQYIAHSKIKKPTISRNAPRVSCDFNNYDPVTRQFYRSLFEVWTARCFAKHNIDFVYEAHAFFLDGKYYTPDFYLPEKEIYVECKGLWKQISKVKIRKLNESASVILLPSYFQKKLKHYRKKDDMVK